MRKQILMAMATLMMISSTVPSYAAVIEAGKAQSQETKSEETTEKKSYSANVDPDINWILNPDDYKTYEHGNISWCEAEGVEQAKKWAEDNKADVEGIQDEKERYKAIVTKVCDFLTYDLKYVQPHIAYTIRDGKGVCGDYTSLTKALCDATNIQAQVSDGIAYGDLHNMLKVTISGHEYYSDPTGVDSGACDVLMEGTPSYYTETTLHDNLRSATITTGASVSQSSMAIQSINAPEGTSVLSKGGKYYYVSLADAELFLETHDDAVIDSILLKYGIPF